MSRMTQRKRSLKSFFTLSRISLKWDWMNSKPTLVLIMQYILIIYHGEMYLTMYYLLLQVSSHSHAILLSRSRRILSRRGDCNTSTKIECRKNICFLMLLCSLWHFRSNYVFSRDKFLTNYNLILRKLRKNRSWYDIICLIWFS